METKDMNIYWQQALDFLKEKMNEVTIQTFIEPLQPVGYTDTYFICTLNEKLAFYKEIINNKYIPKVNEALERVFNRPIIFAFEGEVNISSSVSHTKPVITENGLIPDYVFGNYIVGSSNNMAYAAAVAVADSPGEDDMCNPFFLYGGVGLGKTHLMHAIGNHIVSCNPDAKVLYVSCEKFTAELVEAIRDRKTIEFKDKYRHLDVLLIDDIQYLKGKDAAQEEFFHTFNELINAKKQIVISSDRKPNEIKTLTDRLISRMQKGIIFDIKAPDFETRAAILSKKAEVFNVHISQDIIQYIAYVVTSNIREMEGALKNIVMFARFNNREITMELVEEVMTDIANSTKANITVSYIQEQVADYYKITVDEILSKRRTKPLTTYRHIAMYLCRKFINESLEQIGEKFGGRDHSTVMNGCDNVCKLIEEDPERATEIKQLEKRIIGG